MEGPNMKISEMRYDIQSGHVLISFDAKPEDKILAILKAHSFRWNPASRAWWRAKVHGAADVIGAIERAMRPANEPDGPCWTCGLPGRFRHYGAATPVLCDRCHEQHESISGRKGESDHD
jgi:hypothetical protein